VAIAKATVLNRELDEYRARINPKPKLTSVKPNSVAYLFRLFEASPKYAQYSSRWRQDSRWIYRSLETHLFEKHRMFGDIRIDHVTRQMAYGFYEEIIATHGVESANKMMTACRAAFKYATLRLPNISENPFSRLGKITPPPRRQRWTPEQLDLFVKMAEWLGYPSIGRCALLCMDLMQRPGDMLSLTWGAFDQRRKAWFIRQTKRGVEVFVPPTTRLERVLDGARKKAVAAALGGDISGQFVCPTATGKRWQRRDFTMTARMIARAAGIPDDLQIRDLRRTAATEGASAGATPLELMAVGGWQNQASIRPYLVQTAEQAMACQVKREAYRKRQQQSRPA
jgi:integrase